MNEFENVNVGNGILAKEIAKAIEGGWEKIYDIYDYRLYLESTGIRLIKGICNVSIDRLYQFNDYIDQDKTLLLDWLALDILYDIKENILNNIKKVA